MEIAYLPCSWNTYHRLALKLASNLLSSGYKFDEIIAIARGGLTLGHLLSDLLRVPIATISIQSYTGIQTQGELKITARLVKPIKNQQVLLVDDVADSGKTLIRAQKYLARFHPRSITCATMYYKPHSRFKPDFFVAQTRKWILFPYEPTEMILTLTRQMHKNGHSQNQIRTFLKSLQFNASQIAFVFKYHRWKNS